MNTLNNFSTVSDLKLYSSKFNVLRSGTLKNTNITYLNRKKYTWSSDKAKALGIPFQTNKELFIKENINKEMNKSNMATQISLLGKITVIKSIAL